MTVANNNLLVASSLVFEFVDPCLMWSSETSALNANEDISGECLGHCHEGDYNVSGQLGSMSQQFSHFIYILFATVVLQIDVNEHSVATIFFNRLTSRRCVTRALSNEGY